MKRLSIAQQNERRAALDSIRASRELTPGETAEHDRLINALYMREWRALAYASEARR